MDHLSIANVWVNSLLRSFDRHGLDTAKLASELPGFVPGQTDHIGRLDLVSARRLWHKAAALSDDPLLGVRIGLSQDYRSIGVLAPLLWHCPSVSLALKHVATFQTLISENGVFRYGMKPGEKTLRCLYEETPAALDASPQQILSVIAGTIRYIRELFDQRVEVRSLVVPTHLALDRKGLSSFLKLPLVAEGDRFGFELDTDNFNVPITGCDPTLYQLSLDYAHQLLNAKQKGSELVMNIRGFIANHGLAQASVTQCAHSLQTNARNLQRKLARQGTSFRQLKEEVLKEIAIRELNRGSSIATIAELLGYSETGAFHRAFRGWFGGSPGHLREEPFFNPR